LSITLTDVAHVLPALIRQALADVRAGDKAQRHEAETFLDRVWPTWRNRVNKLTPKVRRNFTTISKQEIL